MTSSEEAQRTPTPDEVNRLWQHGMHEERLFHDRLNYFSFLETGLLTIYGIMYNKEPAAGFFVPICIVGLAFTLLWLVIQLRHWAYCIHVNTRIKRLVPEYKATLETFPGSATGSPSRSRSRCRCLCCSRVRGWRFGVDLEFVTEHAFDEPEA